MSKGALLLMLGVQMFNAQVLFFGVASTLGNEIPTTSKSICPKTAFFLHIP
jgi:hypothetical protein